MTRYLFNLVLLMGYATLTGCPGSQPAQPSDTEAEPQANQTGGTVASHASGGAHAADHAGASGTHNAGGAGKTDDGADAGPTSPHSAGGHSAANGGKGGTAPDAGAAGSGGSPVCDAQCAAGEHCELVQVQCVRAPCPPIAKCVADTTGAARCGSRGSAACPSDQYCEFPADSQCGATDAGGSCKAKPQACTQQYDPVCGCDGQTYGNACSAAGAGVSVATHGECAGSMTPPSGQVTCDPRKVLCKRGTPKCAEGSVPSVVGSCYGDCVPVEQCACDSAAACPLPDSYTCHMSAKHCTPYL